ncbi:MAG: L,D-transpeptidase, partial [Nitratireductor sp.]|nr:L,D-transpeptidase [Nitratireductor sp.]
MKTGILAATAAMFLAALPAAGQAQSRYSAPPAAKLSGDLASPWILQLRRKPSRDGRYAVEVSRPSVTIEPDRSRFVPRYTNRVEREPVRVSAPAAAPVKAKRSEPEFDPRYEPQMVSFEGGEAPGTVIIDTDARFLYLVEDGGMARRYGIGVGRPGFEWAGEHKVTRKAEWPSWTPPEEMRQREAARGKILPVTMDGGPDNPLGARAMYLGDTLYRIHGTNQPWSIGKAVSSGCIRMRNEDVIDLYERVR